MILTTHLLVGAAIAVKIQNPFLALPLAFLTHYLLDLSPHKEYSISNIKAKRWRKSLGDFLKVGMDILLGTSLIFIFSQNQPIIYLGALTAIAPDILVFVGLIFSNKLLARNDDLHEKIHFLENKKIPLWVRFSSQIVIIGLAIFLI